MRLCVSSLVTDPLNATLNIGAAENGMDYISVGTQILNK